MQFDFRLEWLPEFQGRMTCEMDEVVVLEAFGYSRSCKHVRMKEWSRRLAGPELLPSPPLHPGERRPVVPQKAERVEDQVSKRGVSETLLTCSVLGYEQTYISEKYRSGSWVDGTGPIAWRGREQKTDVGYHQIRDCSGMPNPCSLLMTGWPTSWYISLSTKRSERRYSSESSPY